MSITVGPSFQELYVWGFVALVALALIYDLFRRG